MKCYTGEFKFIRLCYGVSFVHSFVAKYTELLLLYDCYEVIKDLFLESQCSRRNGYALANYTLNE